MKLLQELPVIFETIQVVNSYPSKMLNPILQHLIAKANAPLNDDDAGDSHSQEIDLREEPLLYFLLLSKCHMRGKYVAHKEGKLVSCTKKCSI